MGGMLQDSETWLGSSDYAQLVSEQAAALQAAWDAEYNKAQNEHEKELLPVTEL